MGRREYSGYHVIAIDTAARDATCVIDGLLYHESELRIEERYTCTLHRRFHRPRVRVLRLARVPLRPAHLGAGR